MKPITVSVGPLAAAGQLVVNNSAATGPGQFGMVSSGITITGTFANGVLTVTNLSGGVVQSGMRLAAQGLPQDARLIGPAPGSVGNGIGSSWIVYPFASGASGAAIRANSAVVLDAPRQLAITTTQAAPGTLTIFGLDAAGSPIQETLAYNGGNLVTSQNFKVVTQVVTSVAATVTITAAATATSPWVNFDPWAAGNVSIQANVQGVANFTIQISNDDPNDPETPVPPGQMTWMPDPNGSDVGATTNEFNTWQFVPLYARVLLNSGAGSVTTTFVQTANVNR